MASDEKIRDLIETWRRRAAVKFRDSDLEKPTGKTVTAAESLALAAACYFNAAAELAELAGVPFDEAFPRAK